MLTAIVTLRVTPGSGAELEADFKTWSRMVAENEPGTSVYSLCRSRDETDVYYAIESYLDDAAMQLHLSNWRSRTDVPDILSEPPTVKLLDPVPND